MSLDDLIRKGIPLTDTLILKGPNGGSMSNLPSRRHREGDPNCQCDSGDCRKWISTEEAAKVIEVSPRRILALIGEERLEAVKLGGRAWQVFRKSAEAYRDSERKSGNPNFKKS